jgi:RND superfamily putative drug exporter
VRAVLLPAVMALLGRHNWWLPRWLGRLPEVSHEVAPSIVQKEKELERV